MTNEDNEPADFDANNIVTKTRLELSKIRARLHHSRNEIKNAGISEGEQKSAQIDDVIAIPIQDIVIDKDFQNTRLYEDALRPDATSSEGQRLIDLKKSMDTEGQKTPIVVAIGPNKKFLIRAGFRRHKCALELNWEKIRAVVLPQWTNKEDEYWFNILENTARKNLSTFEAANAAKLMRDKFKVTQKVFAEKTGYSVTHVSKLLRCIDHLPEELIQHWRNGTGLSFDQWYKLSAFQHSHNAIEAFRRWTGLPSLTEIDRLKRIKDKKRKKKAPRSLERMQVVINTIHGIDEPLKARMAYQRILEYCMGERDDIPGVWYPQRKTEYQKRIALREQLQLDRSDIPEPVDLPGGEEIPKLEYDQGKRKR